MPTATENLVDALILGLLAVIPNMAEAAGLAAPTDIAYGEPELTPTARCPYIAIDLGEYRQKELSIGGGIQRDPKLAIYAFIAGSDSETVARQIHRWGDILCTAVEGLRLADISPLMVATVDFSPNFRLRGGSALFRAVAVECSGQIYRAHASGP